MTSRPAIEPAISTLPVINQLMAKVSSVPSVRQLTALRTDLVCRLLLEKNNRSCLLSGSDRNLSRPRAGLSHYRRAPVTFPLLSGRLPRNVLGPPGRSIADH